MTTMDNTSPRCFWYELYGPKAGIKHPVKNLGWIIRHRHEVETIHVSESIKIGGGHFSATLKDGRRYYIKFESLTIAHHFANTRRFPNAKIINAG